MTDPVNSDSDQRLRARLALTGEEGIADWQKKEAYLEKRKLEAAAAMASDIQKKAQEEKTLAKIQKEEARKKLAELEAVRKAEEELKKKDLSAQQQERDLAQEKLRQAKIKEILESQRTIERIKKSPQSRLSSIHTLTDDLSEEIKAGGFTATRLAQANRPELSEDKKTVSWRKTFVLTLSFVLVIGGLTAISWSLLQRTEQSQTSAQLTHNSIIFADEHRVIDLKNKTPEQIQQAVALATTPSEATISNREKIRDIYFVDAQLQTAGPAVFASSLGLVITDDLLRFLQPDFMLGVYLGPQTEPFYIFTAVDYKNTADALLHNENDIVSQLLAPFLSADTIAQIKTTSFQDKLLKNRDTRMVLDQDNSTLAIYAWLNKNTIAVTTNEFVLEKILNSFLTPKPVVK